MVAEPVVAPTDPATSQGQVSDQAQLSVTEPEVTPDVVEFLKERGVGEAASTKDGEGTEPDKTKVQDTDDVEAKARQAEIALAVEKAKVEASAEKEKELTAKGKKAETQRQVEGIRQSYQQTAAFMEKALRDAGNTDETVKSVMDAHNWHHAQAELYYSTQYTDGLYGFAAAELTEAEREAFLDPNNRHTSTADLLKAVRKSIETQAREGFLSKKEHDAGVTRAVSDYRRDLLKDDGAKLRALLTGAHAVGGTNSSAGAGGGGLSFRTQAEADAAHVRGEITNAQRQAVANNRSIPDF